MASPRWREPCWNRDGRDLLVPGSLPVGPGVAIATCAGDLDGVLGSVLARGTPEGW